MRLHPQFAHCALFVFLLMTSACTGSKQMINEAPAPSQTSSDTSTEAPANSEEATRMSAEKAAELEAIFWKRQETDRSRFVQANVDFMSGMIGHHAQALIMSAHAPDNGANPAVQRLAARIINAQKDEIALMQKWLKDRGQEVPMVHIMNGKLMIHGGGDHHMDHSTMPGMLSDEQLDELSKAKDVEFDRLFLTYMIQHHKGALTMVDDMFAVDGAGNDEAAFKIASDINVDQITEINRNARISPQNRLDTVFRPLESFQLTKT